MKKILALVLVLMLVLVAAVACAPKADAPAADAPAADAPAADKPADEPADEPAADDEQKFVGISFPSTLVDRWPAEAEYLKSGLEALGYKAEIQYADEDANKQYSQCDNFISQGVDLIVVCAVDTVTAAQIVETAHAEDVAVFSYCRLLENCEPDGFIGEDNAAVGKLQGGYIAENVESGNIIVVGGSPADSNGLLYHEKGVEAIQAKVDDGSYTIVADQYCDAWDPAVALANVENALTQCGNDVAAVLCPNDGLAGGAVEALTAQGLAGKVVVTGGDGELAAAKRIVAGTQSMTIFKDSKLIAGAGVEAIDAFLKGETPAYNGVLDNGTAEINAVLVDMIVVTKDNIKEIFVDGGVFTAEEIGL
ncbi:MAG: substrate-binding domain-containing protein [Christensenellaceae bacterium]|nr:substrate-binding domain-containing protein [Christensenellaceae bacterium]